MEDALMTYTDLIFDLYGTLVDIHTEENDLVWEKTALYFSFHGAHYTGDELRAAFRAVMAAQEAKKGQAYECFPDIPFEEVMAKLFRAKGVEHTETLAVNAAQLFRISSIEYIRLYPYVLQSLEQLRAHGYRLWLLSNAQAIFTRAELRHLGLEEAFDGVYLSSDYRCRKPDGRFFHALLDEQQLDPARSLMIGNDLETDIGGAKAAGHATLYLHTNLTPPHQREAKPSAAPHYEWEGSDWGAITDFLLTQ